MKKLFALVAALATMFAVSACNGDDVPSGDAGTAVSGVYTGKLLYGTETIEDAYVVIITRISSSVVAMTADFLDGSANFNVTKNGSTYSLNSETIHNITTTINGKQLNISYLTTGGYMFSFAGSKD